ncbi:hypothetical protein DPMN_170755 [Dreissena polymorpha]|uniref:DUF6451 domain-containing protein n=1 Tax=Dreissena polymorpha TaxID=45954 RepID=A0A9D4E0E1_DREPO|nr:hypothetical protein DPMN_170755 [Dreissena polymorpha]
MRRTTEERRQGIQWTPTSLLDDLDYANASRNQDIQQKTKQLALSASTGSQGKHWQDSGHEEDHQSGRPNNHQRPTSARSGRVHFHGQQGHHRDLTSEINTRISKTNQVFAMLKPIWRTTSLSMHTKLRVFKSMVLSVLLYG